MAEEKGLSGINRHRPHPRPDVRHRFGFVLESLSSADFAISREDKAMAKVEEVASPAIEDRVVQLVRDHWQGVPDP